jgi:hypothetical protein
MGKWCNWRRSWLNTTTCLSSSWLVCSLQAVQRHIALHIAGNNNKKSVTYLLPATRYHMHNLECRVTKDTYIYLRHAFHLASRQEEQTQCSSQALRPSCLISFPSTRSYWIKDHIESLDRGKKKRTGRLQRQNEIAGQFLQSLCMHPVHLRDVQAPKGKTDTVHRERQRDAERGNLTWGSRK